MLEIKLATKLWRWMSKRQRSRARTMEEEEILPAEANERCHCRRKIAVPWTRLFKKAKSTNAH
ncbi:hypothetical protein Tsubulata_041486, partial [Turnera subulata]